MMRVEKLTKGSESIEKFKSMVNIPASVLRGKSKKEKIELFQGVMYESFLHFISCRNKCSIDCKIDVSWDDDYEWSLRKIRVVTRDENDYVTDVTIKISETLLTKLYLCDVYVPVKECYSPAMMAMEWMMLVSSKLFTDPFRVFGIKDYLAAIGEEDTEDEAGCNEEY